MPFESQAQRAWMHANRPAMAERWEDHTPSDAKLPKRRRRKGKGLTANAKRRKFKRKKRFAAEGSAQSRALLEQTRRLARIDPTRSISERHKFAARVRAKFARIKLAVHDLLVKQDAFGMLRRQKLVEQVNNQFCPTGEGGGVDPSCSPGLSQAGIEADGKLYPEKITGEAREEYITKVEEDITKVEKSDKKRKVVDNKTGKSKFVRLASIGGILLTEDRELESRLRSYKKGSDGKWYVNRGNKLEEATGDSKRVLLKDVREIAEIAAEKRFSKETKFDGDALKTAKRIREDFDLPVRISVPDDSNSRYVFAKMPKGGEFKIRFADHGQPMEQVGDRVIPVGGFDRARGIRHSAADVSIDPYTKDDINSALGALNKLLKTSGMGVVHNNEWEEGIRSDRPVANEFCPTGEGGGVDPSCPSTGGGSGGSAAGSILRWAASAPGRLLSSIKNKAQAKYAKLSARYGPKYAKAIIGAALAGIPVPIPGSSFITAAPVIALAEMHRWVSGGPATNIFCPTGEGGGVDPGCSPRGTEIGAGTKERPVKCGSNIKLAAQLLSAGRYVELDQPDQVSTLIKKLGKIIRRAEEQGIAKPKIDLCKVSVPGTNLFCQETKGIPRIQMPQMRGMPEPDSKAALKEPVNKLGKVDIGREFIAHLESQGVKVETTTVRASHLRASQLEIDGARVIELMGKAKEGKNLREREIFVTRDNYVLDGHHHWAAIIGQGYARGRDLKIPVHRLDMEIGRGVAEANAFAKAYGIKPKSVDTANAAPPDEMTPEEIEEAAKELRRELEEEQWEDEEGDVTENANDFFAACKRKEIPTANAPRFEFRSTEQQRQAFLAWIKKQVDSTLRSKSEDDLWRLYIESGFKKGAARSYDDAVKTPLFDQNELRDFYAGSKDQFLRSSFRQPESVEKVKLLAGRTFQDLDNVTDDMAVRMSRTLVDGLTQGRHPLDVARDMEDALDIGRNRAELIARTEFIRAHAEGQLQALEDMGVEEVGVAVEWTVTDDEVLCEECAAMSGVVLRIEEAHNMIPRHPGCRCAFLPANVGEKDNDQVDTAAGVKAAIRESQGGDEESWGPNAPISRSRPESILNQAAENAGQRLPRSNKRTVAVDPDLLTFSRLLRNA